jgi:hypothetical protein
VAQDVEHPPLWGRGRDLLECGLRRTPHNVRDARSGVAVQLYEIRHGTTLLRSVSMWIKATLIGAGVLFGLIGIGGIILAVATDDFIWLYTFAVPFLLGSFIWFGVVRRFGRIVSPGDIDDPVSGTATVLGVRSTGATVNDVPLIEFQLRVQIPGRLPYDTEVGQLVRGGAIGIGMVVPVKAERVDQDEVVIDFDAAAAAPVLAGEAGELRRGEPGPGR